MAAWPAKIKIVSTFVIELQLNISGRFKCNSTSDLIFAQGCPAGPRIVIPQNERGELIKSDVKKDNVS